MRFKACISFDGTTYSGWQLQPNAITVQGEIESVLSQLYQQKVDVIGCGRTDAGVHATTFFLHFNAPEALFNEDQLLYKINTMTPSSIAFKELKKHPSFHARFDATNRQYKYFIHTSKDPFSHRYSFYYPKAASFDLKNLNATATELLRYNDFATFCKSRSDVQTTHCILTKATWSKNGQNGLVFHIAADRFLRGMVRLIVGATLLIEEGQLSLDDLIGALDMRRRLVKDWSVPACGLALVGVDYPSS